MIGIALIGLLAVGRALLVGPAGQAGWTFASCFVRDWWLWARGCVCVLISSRIIDCLDYTLPHFWAIKQLVGGLALFARFKLVTGTRILPNKRPTSAAAASNNRWRCPLRVREPHKSTSLPAKGWPSRPSDGLSGSRWFRAQDGTESIQTNDLSIMRTNHSPMI